MSNVVEPSPAAIRDAADRLRRGGVVAIPTETVYGLAADTFQPFALFAVYAMKGRPEGNPLIAHVLDVAAARRVAAGWDERCDRLADRFWPGPLTLVLPRADGVPDRATAGLPTIAVRSPRHDVARAVLEAFGGTLSAPSANRSGHVSPTTAAHVAADFADVADLLILDGGRCEVGLESTVLDLAGPVPAVLRPGSVTTPELREILGDVETPAIETQAASPGTSPRHYAPRTRAVLVPPRELLAHLVTIHARAAVLAFETSVPAPHHAIEMPQGAGAYARRLYEALRAADDLGLDCIVIETPPDTNEMWKAVRDRLRRAVSP